MPYIIDNKWNKVVEYYVVKWLANDFRDRVNKMIKEWRQPYWNYIIWDNSESQAMVKYEKITEEIENTTKEGIGKIINIAWLRISNTNPQERSIEQILSDFRYALENHSDVNMSDYSYKNYNKSEPTQEMRYGVWDKVQLIYIDEHHFWEIVIIDHIRDWYYIDKKIEHKFKDHNIDHKATAELLSKPTDTSSEANVQNMQVDSDRIDEITSCDKFPYHTSTELEIEIREWLHEWLESKREDVMIEYLKNLDHTVAHNVRCDDPDWWKFYKARQKVFQLDSQD